MGVMFRVLQSTIIVEEVSGTTTVSPSPSSLFSESTPLLNDSSICAPEEEEESPASSTTAAGGLSEAAVVGTTELELGLLACNSWSTSSREIASEFFPRMIKCQRFLIVLSEKEVT